MNYLSQVMKYLSSASDIAEIYMVSKAPPVDRRDEKLIKIMDVTLNPEDIRDTLLALRSYTSSSPGPLGNEGVFSFGISNIGRFRVSYTVQRGSYAVNIVKTPYNIPMLEELCENNKHVHKLDEIVRLHRSGIILVLGKNLPKISTFVYSLLQYISKHYTKVILTLEKPISFLLRHDRSLVIQIEAGTDTPTFEEGLRSILYMNPDVVYIDYRSITLNEKILQGLYHLVQLDTLLFFHPSFMSDDTVMEDLKQQKELIKAIIKVESSKTEERLNIRITDTEHQALENH
ncbi:MAG: ATPase, T2SS/T4P/T4SS family [Aquificaceae bacterium]